MPNGGFNSDGPVPTESWLGRGDRESEEHCHFTASHFLLGSTSVVKLCTVNVHCLVPYQVVFLVCDFDASVF